VIDHDALNRKLAAPAIRVALQRAGIFLTGWELLKNDIEDRVRGFYEIRTGTVDERYESEVLSRSKHRLEASVLWLVEMGALTEARAARVQEIREHRNEIAHQLPKLLVDPNHEIDLTLMKDMAVIIRAIGAFFGRIAMDSDPEFAGRDVKDEDIRSGTSLLMDHLVAACEATHG
jgi:hypothetical protein